MSKRCLICGADLLPLNPNLCKNFHDQTVAREIRNRQLEEIKQRDDAIRNKEQADMLDAFLDEIRKEDFENCGFVDMDSIEAIYIRLKESLSSPIKEPELKEENKPGCFGAIGLPGKRNDPGCPCGWRDRCRQAQDDA